MSLVSTTVGEPDASPRQKVIPQTKESDSTELKGAGLASEPSLAKKTPKAISPAAKMPQANDNPAPALPRTRHPDAALRYRVDEKQGRPQQGDPTAKARGLFRCEFPRVESESRKLAFNPGDGPFFHYPRHNRGIPILARVGRSVAGGC